jgi:hypothetical protein
MNRSAEITVIVRLSRFVEDSHLSFYQIASLIGTSGTTGLPEQLGHT